MIRLLAALWVMTASIAGAETVGVRSGDHGDFTRIVVDLPEGVGWALGRETDAYELRLDRRGVEFDISRVYRTISRERVSDVTALPGGGRLLLALNCECRPRAFLTDSGAVVIDIRNGAPDSTSEFEKPLPVFERSASGVSRNDMPVQPKPDPDRAASQAPAGDGAGVWVAGHSAPASQVLPLGPDIPLARPPRLATVDAASADEPDSRQEQARQLLLEQFAKAAAQGLIRVEGDLPSAPLTDPEPGPERSAPQQSVVEQAPSFPVRASTSVQSAQPLPAEDRSFTAAGDDCPAEQRFALRDWTSDAPAADQIAERRAALVGEIDIPDPDAVKDLARLYIALAMGPEAELVQRAFRQEPDADLLAIARILDDRPLERPEDLVRYADCATSVALWAVLAARDPASTPAFDAAAILRGFKALPDPVRRAVTPRLVAFFMAHGDQESVRILRNSLSASHPEDAAPLNLADAELAMQSSTGVINARIDALALSNDPLSPQATRAAIEARLAAGQPVAEALATHAEALAFASGDEDIGAGLAGSAALAWASASVFDRAKDILDRVEYDLDPDSRSRVVARFVQMLTSGADDAMFLRIAFARSRWLSAEVIGDDANLGAALRLSELGFHGLASDLLGPASKAGEAAGLVLASNDLENGDIDAAVERLSVLGDPAEALLAQARELSGDPQGAVAGLLRAGDSEGALQTAWSNGLWPDAQRLATGARLRAIELSRPAIMGEDPLPSLASARGLVDRARETRAVFEDLLAVPDS
ncbi:hypothetical protein OEW28_00425 [Defluviimonas sp. WL0002]|uniref:Uncharacterized protein n=1 Tax=Albidovulum marisflavi TaxID=2984159 RepID=A0ABT2Z7H2_9RHOB|nr:hypothetical protein [Defluviimonas sp. WL0002]MCV2867088.1 hypothetical protein [Defluviimonas sp. WL0002]